MDFNLIALEINFVETWPLRKQILIFSKFLIFMLFNFYFLKFILLVLISVILFNFYFLKFIFLILVSVILFDFYFLEFILLISILLFCQAMDLNVNQSRIKMIFRYDRNLDY